MRLSADVRSKTTSPKNEKPADKRALRQTLVTCEENLERAKGFEPSTPTLARRCSTTELHPHPSVWRRHLAGNGQSYAKCGSRMQQPGHRRKSAGSPVIGNNAQRFARNPGLPAANLALLYLWAGN